MFHQITRFRIAPCHTNTQARTRHSSARNSGTSRGQAWLTSTPGRAGRTKGGEVSPGDGFLGSNGSFTRLIFLTEMMSSVLRSYFQFSLSLSLSPKSWFVSSLFAFCGCAILLWFGNIYFFMREGSLTWDHPAATFCNHVKLGKQEYRVAYCMCRLRPHVARFNQSCPYVRCQLYRKTTPIWGSDNSGRPHSG